MVFLEFLGYFLVACPLLSSEKARIGVTLHPSLRMPALKMLQKASEALLMNCAFHSLNLHSNSIRFYSWTLAVIATGMRCATWGFGAKYLHCFTGQMYIA